MVMDHLAKVETQIRASKKKITDQLEFIAWLAWLGKDAAGAKSLLRGFERALARQIADKERLFAELVLLDGAAQPLRAPASHRSGHTRDPRLSADQGFAVANAV